MAEGREGDARRLLIDILRAGNADRIVQRLAADMLDAPPKKRGRPKASLPMHWFEIAEEFHRARRSTGYEAAILAVSEKFVCSETHVRNCVRVYDEAKAAADAEAEWQMEQLDRK